MTPYQAVLVSREVRMRGVTAAEQNYVRLQYEYGQAYAAYQQLQVSWKGKAPTLPGMCTGAAMASPLQSRLTSILLKQSISLCKIYLEVDSYGAHRRKWPKKQQLLSHISKARSLQRELSAKMQHKQRSSKRRREVQTTHIPNMLPLSRVRQLRLPVEGLSLWRLHMFQSSVGYPEYGCLM